MINVKSRPLNSPDVRGLLTPGPLLVLVFIAESLIAKGSFPGLRIGFALHMLLTTGLLGMLAVAGEVWALRCPPNVWLHAWKRGENVRVMLFVLVTWGLISTVTQSRFPEANFIFWALWALNYFVMFRSVPRLLSGCDLDQRVALIMIVLIVGLVGSILHPHYQMGRFVGVYGNATWTGHFFAATVVFAFALMVWRRWKWPMLVFGAGLVLLVMSRTRGGVAGAAIGLITVTWVVAQHNSVHSKRIVLSTALLFSIVGIGGGVYLSSSGRSERAIQAAASHLRIEEGMESIRKARGMNQAQGSREFWNNGPFGRGFLSKYGDDTAREIFGIEVPRYDWTTDDDPLNSFYLVNQQIGLPGMCLFIAFLMALLAAGLHLTPLARMFFLSLWSIGIFLSFFSVAWAVSFGDSWDRFCLVALSALMYSPATPQTATIQVPTES